MIIMSAEAASVLFTATLVGVFGLAIGSFLNVVVYRVPIHQSIVSPPSACPGCHSEIKAYDNVPIISWLILRGHCRTCKTKISVRYPLVEAGTALFFVLVGIAFARTVSAAATPALAISAALVLVALLYLAAISVALAIVDIETHTLPNKIVLPAYAVEAALLLAAAIVGGHWDALLRGGIGMVAFAVFYFILMIIRPDGMGFGDVKLSGALGLVLGWMGWGSLITGLFAAFVLGGLFGIVLILARKANRKSGIPYGPWMLAGAWIGIFFGNSLWDGYLSLTGIAG
jgi:leader peptidase (prepilin peptidase)/N-methyltransferase